MEETFILSVASGKLDLEGRAQAIREVMNEVVIESLKASEQSGEANERDPLMELASLLIEEGRIRLQLNKVHRWLLDSG